MALVAIDGDLLARNVDRLELFRDIIGRLEESNLSWNLHGTIQRALRREVYKSLYKRLARRFKTEAAWVDLSRVDAPEARLTRIIEQELEASLKIKGLNDITNRLFNALIASASDGYRVFYKNNRILCDEAAGGKKPTYRTIWKAFKGLVSEELSSLRYETLADMDHNKVRHAVHDALEERGNIIGRRYSPAQGKK